MYIGFMGEIELTIYTKPECGLCDEMKEVVASLQKELNVTLKEVDITADTELEEKYSLDIPILFYGERCLARHRAHERTLLKKIQKMTENLSP